jgi:hypothetical protein
MTIAGAHTVAELIDLVAAKDYVIGRMQKSYDSISSDWQSKDAPTQSKWLSDWNALKGRYGRAHALADIEIANAKIQPVPNSVIPAETTYNLILSSLQKTSGVVSPGDLQDLYNRLSAAGQAQQLAFSVPQPSAIDVDSVVLQTPDPLQAIVQNPKKSAAIAIGLGVAGLIGYTAIVKRI